MSTFQTITINDPNITLSQFNINYQIKTDRSYSIYISPTSSYLYFNSLIFNASVVNVSPNYYIYSSDGYQFSNTIYTLNSNFSWTIVEPQN